LQPTSVAVASELDVRASHPRESARRACDADGGDTPNPNHTMPEQRNYQGKQPKRQGESSEQEVELTSSVF